MGKKRVVKNVDSTETKKNAKSGTAKISKRKLASGILHVDASFNNTRLVLTDDQGGVVSWSSSGSLGFKGAKKGTPYAAAQVGELLGDKAKLMGLSEADVVVKGVGAGRESSIRAFFGKGINIKSIRDETSIPHGGPTPKKPRKV